MGNARLRPRPVPHIATETIVQPPGTPDIADPAVRAAVQSIQRTVDVLAGPAKAAATHPSLHDQVIEIDLRSGDNWIDHGLGRAPRFVYVTFALAPASWLTWGWVRKDGDSDRARIHIVVAVGGPTGAPIIVGGSPPTFHALVRLE